MKSSFVPGAPVNEGTIGRIEKLGIAEDRVLTVFQLPTEKLPISPKSYVKVFLRPRVVYEITLEVLNVYLVPGARGNEDVLT